MKSAVILFLTLTLVGLSLSAQLTPDDVHAELQLYARQRGFGMRMMRGGPSSMQCYDKYIPEINNMAEQSKNESQFCITTAENERAEELNQIETERVALEYQVEIIQDSFGQCLNKTDIFEYLKCLENATEVNQVALDEITHLLEKLNERLSATFGAIEAKENLCIVKSIEEAKNATDDLFDALQDCLINGFEEQQPTTTTEVIVVTSTVEESGEIASTEAETEAEQTLAPEIEQPEDEELEKNSNRLPEEDI